MLSALLACSHVPVTAAVEGDAPSWARLRREGVAVAPVQIVHDLPVEALPLIPPPREIEDGLAIADQAPPTLLDPVRDAAFLRNDFTGNVRFGGGYVRTGDVALEVRARLIEFGQEDAYARQGATWLAGALGAAVEARGIDATAAEIPAVAPGRSPVRGQHEDDGHDNLNAPRTRLEPPAVSPLAAGSWVLVPWLRAYYTHNGGWFLGQEYGCLGGARVEVMVALYDAATGRPVWWMEATGRHLQPANGQPSRAELDQSLLWAEEQVEKALETRLFR